MAVLSEVTAAIDKAGVTGWQRALALALAEAMDESPNASTAKELKTLMAELGAAQVEAKVAVSDDLAARRTARRRAASS